MNGAWKFKLRSSWIRGLVLASGLLGLYAVSSLIEVEVRKSNLYSVGISAATASRWSEAFSYFHSLTRIDPNYRDVQNRVREAADRLAQADIYEPDLSTQLELLHWLVTSQDIDSLADVLDHRMVIIPAGEFTIGSANGRSDEQPERSVYLDAFEIDRFEVTNAQYRRFLIATGRTAPVYWSGNDYPIGKTDYPVVGVRWDDADAYCRWAGKRLPSEAEWEKTCRNPDDRIYPWGNTWDSRNANVEVSAPSTWPLDWTEAWPMLQTSQANTVKRGLQPIGSHPNGATADGVLDLVGNAAEWVADWYSWTGYQNLPTRNPHGMGPPWNHSLRGSSWFDPYGNTAWTQEMSRCSARNSSHETSDPRVGFRCAR